MRFIGVGGKRSEMPAVSQEELKNHLLSKEDLMFDILGRTLKDYPILIGNVDPKDVMNRHLAKMIDIFASIASNPYPTEPEVLPRFLGYSVFTITEPREVDQWSILDEVDKVIGGELKVLYPKITLKAFPNENEARRIAFFGKGNQDTLNNLSSEMRKLFAPGLFAECMAFIGDSEQANYILLVELGGDELTQANLLKESSLAGLAKHFTRESDLFTNHGLQQVPLNTNNKNERRN
jgi:hypothetical protein